MTPEIEETIIVKSPLRRILEIALAILTVGFIGGGAWYSVNAQIAGNKEAISKNTQAISLLQETIKETQKDNGKLLRKIYKQVGGTDDGE